MDLTKNTSTGSLLGTYEKAVDVGIFDGSLMAGSAATSRSSSATPASSRRRPIRLPTKAHRRRTLILALAGAALIIAGFVAVAYAGFQLYGTNILAARSQDELTDAFEARRAEGPAPVVAGLVASDVVDPSEFEDPDDVPIVVGAITEAPLAPPINARDWISEGAPEHGAPVGRLVIPQLDLDWVVIEGVKVADLKKGPGHMPNSAMPGQAGNAVISGHRTTYGAPFNRLDELQPGDRFTFETLIGVHTYEVVSLLVVRPSEAWVTTPWPGAWMTFTTCHPEYSSRQRLIVFSKLVDGPNSEAAANEYGTEYLPPVAPNDGGTRTPIGTTTTTTTAVTTTTEPEVTTTTEPAVTTTVPPTTTTTTDPPTTTTTRPATTTTTTEPPTTTTTEPPTTTTTEPPTTTTTEPPTTTTTEAPPTTTEG